MVSHNSSEVQEESCTACRFMDESNMKKEMRRIKDKEMKIMINVNCDLKDYVTNGNIYSARRDDFEHSLRTCIF